SRASETRTRGLHLLRMGPLRQQPQSQILQVDPRGQETAPARGSAMGTDHCHPGTLPGPRRGAFVRGLRAWFLRLAGLFRQQRRDQEFAAELESHLQMHIDDNLRAGMSPAEARRQALIKLGGIEPSKELYVSLAHARSVVGLRTPPAPISDNQCPPQNRVVATPKRALFLHPAVIWAVAGGGSIRSAPRLRQFGEFTVRANRWSSEGNGGAHRTRRRPLTSRALVHYRDALALLHRRRP